ncbi:hypothetical protein LX36DRAFT_715876 [Colletotrichum falcatum]|nr:hypothetical protein LX36DRAFT_715876 [Colletotrichum falcatum]
MLWKNSNRSGYLDIYSSGVLRKPQVLHANSSKLIPLVVCRWLSAPPPVSRSSSSLSRRRLVRRDATPPARSLPQSTLVPATHPHVVGEMLKQYKVALMRFVDLDLELRLRQCKVVEFCILSDAQDAAQRKGEADNQGRLQSGQKVCVSRS